MTEFIAHRGTPRDFPENSIPGFLHALELGADGIELDVHATSDQVLVVHHDPSVKAAGQPSHVRSIHEMTYTAVQGYPLASGVPIPTLPQVLEAIAGRATVYVEIKATGIESLVVDVIRRADAVRWCAVHSFDHRSARRVAALNPAIPTGILLDSYLIDPVHALRAAGARDCWQRSDFIDEALVRAIHDAGGRVIAWTVNAVEAGVELAKLGVDGLCTDVCGTLRNGIIHNGVFRAPA